MHSYVLPQCVGRSEARWVLKKIIPSVMKNNIQWFWCQTISIHQSFLYEHKYSDLDRAVLDIDRVVLDIDPACGAVDQAVLVERITLDVLVIVHDMFIK